MRGVITLLHLFAFMVRTGATFLGMFEELQNATISFIMSVHLPVCPSAWNNLAPTGRIFMKFDICIIFQKTVEKI